MQKVFQILEVHRDLVKKPNAFLVWTSPAPNVMQGTQKHGGLWRGGQGLGLPASAEKSLVL